MHPLHRPHNTPPPPSHYQLTAPVLAGEAVCKHPNQVLPGHCVNLHQRRAILCHIDAAREVDLCRHLRARVRLWLNSHRPLPPLGGFTLLALDRCRAHPGISRGGLLVHSHNIECTNEAALGCPRQCLLGFRVGHRPTYSHIGQRRNPKLHQRAGGGTGAALQLAPPVQPLP